MTKRFVTLTPLAQPRRIVPFGDRMKKSGGRPGGFGRPPLRFRGEAKLSRGAPVPDEPAAAILLCAVLDDRADRRIVHILL